MPTTMPPEPATFRNPQEVVTYLQAVIDSESELTPSGLRPKIEHLADSPSIDGADFLLTATGEGFGGGAGVYFHLTPEELDRPGKARLTFRSARLLLSSKLRKNLTRQIAERERGSEPTRECHQCLKRTPSETNNSRHTRTIWNRSGSPMRISANSTRSMSPR